ncbi:MAG: hypothetical protein JNK67_31820 [Alphaproteobacteria bacterium]|nr:hypothetical protein [Alphaproteobacteria bacterium]
MPSRRIRLLAMLALATAASMPRPAAAIVVTLGEQDFADGSTVATIPYNTASAGEPAPFGGLIGNDNDTDFDATWTFVFPAAAYASATLRFGIVDHDSGDPGSQVASFTVDGVDLTAAIDALFEADAGHNGDLFVYDIALPAAALPGLSDGAASFTLVLQGPTFSTLGVMLPNNSAGLDFSTLTLAEDATAVPSPGTAALLGAGLLAACARRRAGSARR